MEKGLQLIEYGLKNLKSFEESGNSLALLNIAIAQIEEAKKIIENN